MHKQDTVKFIHNLFQEVWTELNMDKLKQYYHEDLVGYIAGANISFQDVKNRLEYIKKTYHSIKNDLQEILVDKDKIALRLQQTYYSKHNEALHVYELMAIYQLRGEKISAAWAIISPHVEYFAK